jgi:hypothetical protein
VKLSSEVRADSDKKSSFTVVVVEELVVTPPPLIILPPILAPWTMVFGTKAAGAIGSFASWLTGSDSGRMVMTSDPRPDTLGPEFAAGF